MGAYLYNLWQDPDIPAGCIAAWDWPDSVAPIRLGKRSWTSMPSVKSEGKAWSFGGVTGLPPAYKRALVSLSPGGGDAHQIREFDLRDAVVRSQRLYTASRQKCRLLARLGHVVCWDRFRPRDPDRSGYPRMMKLWKRDEPLSAARLLYECQPSSVTPKGIGSGLQRRISTSWRTSSPFGRRAASNATTAAWNGWTYPETAVINGGYNGQLLLRLRDDWHRGSRNYPAGSLLLADPAALRGTGAPLRTIFQPATNEVLQSAAAIPQGVFRHAPG